MTVGDAGVRGVPLGVGDFLAGVAFGVGLGEGVTLGFDFGLGVGVGLGLGVGLTLALGFALGDELGVGSATGLGVFSSSTIGDFGAGKLMSCLAMSFIAAVKIAPGVPFSGTLPVSDFILL